MTVTDLAGLAVLNQNSCAACHTIDGLGGTKGPDLSRAGARWSESHLREYIQNPERRRDATVRHVDAPAAR